MRNASSGELRIYVDGEEHACGGANTQCTVTNHTLAPDLAEAPLHHSGRLLDAPHRVKVGYGFQGCLSHVEIHAQRSLAPFKPHRDEYMRALRSVGIGATSQATHPHVAALREGERLEAPVSGAVDDSHGVLSRAQIVSLMQGTTLHRKTRYSLFYYYLSDPDSAHLHSQFKESVSEGSSGVSAMFGCCQRHCGPWMLRRLRCRPQLALSGNTGLVLKGITTGNSTINAARWGFKLKMCVASRMVCVVRADIGM